MLYITEAYCQCLNVSRIQLIPVLIVIFRTQSNDDESKIKIKFVNNDFSVLVSGLLIKPPGYWMPMACLATSPVPERVYYRHLDMTCCKTRVYNII